jgi:hypothetical protein
MSVTLTTRVTSYPSCSRNRFRSRNTTYGRALPTWMREYVVGPQA